MLIYRFFLANEGLKHKSRPTVSVHFASTTDNRDRLEATAVQNNWNTRMYSEVLSGSRARNEGGGGGGGSLPIP